MRKALAIDPAHREDRAQLDHDVEELALRPLDAEQAVGENQMPGRGNRQKLGQPLDNAEETGGKIIGRVHGPLRCPRPRHLSSEPTLRRPLWLSGWFRSTRGPALVQSWRIERA